MCVSVSRLTLGKPDDPRLFSHFKKYQAKFAKFYEIALNFSCVLKKKLKKGKSFAYLLPIYPNFHRHVTGNTF